MNRPNEENLGTAAYYPSIRDIADITASTQEKENSGNSTGRTTKS